MKQSEAPILELRSIYKSFGAKNIHRGVNLSLYPGESIALLGGSGTGKSVLLRQIIGLDKVDSGEVIFKGQHLESLSEDELTPFRIKISFSFQSGALFDSSNVFENIAYPLFEHTQFSYKQIQDKVAEMLELIDMKGTEEVMPSDLSGGMQKRVGMARAMILRPDIVLYDEPTAGLDPSNTLNVVSLMRKLKEKGFTSIFVTHDIPSALALCDRIVILNEGRIAFNDTPENFLKSKLPFVTKFHTHLDKILY